MEEKRCQGEFPLDFRNAPAHRAMTVPIESMGTSLGHARARASRPWHAIYPLERSYIQVYAHGMNIVWDTANAARNRMDARGMRRNDEILRFQ
jgi:predicted lipase